MALFPKSPEKTLERERDAAKINVDRLAARAVDAEKAVAARRSEAQQLAFDNADDGVLGKAEAALRGALDRQGTISAASVEAGKLLALLELKIAELLDKKVRATTAAELAEMAISLETADAAVGVAMSALAKIATRAAAFLFDAKGLEHFATSSQVQIPEAVCYVAMLLRERARLCLAGEAPATLATPVAAFVPMIPAKPVTRRLFSLKPVSWTDANGDLRVAQRWTDVDLPLACADRALATNACTEMTDPARSQRTLRQWPGHPNPANCFNLDEPGTATADTVDEQQHDAVLHSFVENVGQPYQLRVAR